MRNRGIKGRNNIQDAYDDKQYKVVERLQDNVYGQLYYIVEALQEERPSTIVDRGKLLHRGDIARATQPVGQMKKLCYQVEKRLTNRKT